MKIQILKVHYAQFYWRIVASNGRILATSEMYKSKQACAKTACRLRIYNTITIEDLTK